MAESSVLLQSVSDSNILRNFRSALVALYPMLVAVDCLEDDQSLYDPFDRVADCLWNELVLKSLQWKYGLNSEPKLPSYGVSGVGPGAGGYFQIRNDEVVCGQFICFIGDRAFGEELFNAIAISSNSNKQCHIALSDSITFTWIRGHDT